MSHSAVSVRSRPCLNGGDYHRKRLPRCFGAGRGASVTFVKACALTGKISVCYLVYILQTKLLRVFSTFSIVSHFKKQKCYLHFVSILVIFKRYIRVVFIAVTT